MAHPCCCCFGCVALVLASLLVRARARAPNLTTARAVAGMMAQDESSTSNLYCLSSRLPNVQDVGPTGAKDIITFTNTTILVLASLLVWARARKAGRRDLSRPTIILVLWAPARARALKLRTLTTLVYLSCLLRSGYQY